MLAAGRRVREAALGVTLTVVLEVGVVIPAVVALTAGGDSSTAHLDEGGGSVAGEGAWESGRSHVLVCVKRRERII
jgi:hypothetical protein